MDIQSVRLYFVPPTRRLCLRIPCRSYVELEEDVEIIRATFCFVYDV